MAKRHHIRMGQQQQQQQQTLIGSCWLIRQPWQVEGPSSASVILKLLQVQALQLWQAAVLECKCKQLLMMIMSIMRQQQHQQVDNRQQRMKLMIYMHPLKRRWQQQQQQLLEQVVMKGRALQLIVWSRHNK
jgi:hypothetical protein